MLIEHSVAEGIVIINMVEHALREAEQMLKQLKVIGGANLYDKGREIWLRPRRSNCEIIDPALSPIENL